MLKELGQFKGGCRETVSRYKNLAKRTLWRAQRKQLVHFLHIGKTGGTAVHSAIRATPGGSKGYALILHPHRTKLMDVPEGEGVVFFLRDPCSRFVSAFNARRRQDWPRYDSPWKRGEETAFARFDSPNQLAMALSSQNHDKRAAAEAAMRSIQHIRDSYWKWFDSEEYLRSRVADLFYIGHQETLSKDFETLKGLLGFPERLQLPDDDVSAHRNPDYLDTDLAHEAVENLRRWYRDDYRLIDICEELRRIGLKTCS